MCRLSVDFLFWCLNGFRSQGSQIQKLGHILKGAVSTGLFTSASVQAVRTFRVVDLLLLFVCFILHIKLTQSVVHCQEESPSIALGSSILSVEC